MIYTFDKLEDFCDLLSEDKEIYLAAAGNYGNAVGKFLDQRGVVWNGYFDGNKQRQCVMLNEKTVSSYQDIYYRDNQIFIICTIMRAKEIEDILIQQGVDDKNIIRFDNRMLFGWISYELEHPEEQIQRLEELKEVGKQYKRCFVIGTGPSLSIDDLEMLKDEFTFSVNSIINCFNMTNWRPTCYVAQDPEQRKELVQYGMSKLSEECKYMLFAVKSTMLEYAEQFENVYIFNSMDTPYDELPRFSSDATDVIYESSTVIYSVLQLAYYMGFEEIYMLGVDLGFARIRDSQGVVTENGEKQATAEFLMSNTKNEPVYELERILRGYKSAKQYAKQNGLMIKNATRGGYLEELERVALEDVLKRRL